MEAADFKGLSSIIGNPQEEHFATREIVADAAGRGECRGAPLDGQVACDSQEFESSELLLRESGTVVIARRPGSAVPARRDWESCTVGLRAVRR
jgi:hypothetical protein